MIDFRGWASNWEWSGYSYEDPPAWAAGALAIPAIFGAACVVLSLAGASELGILWILGSIGAAFAIELFTRDGLDQKALLVFSYALTILFAGAAALVALRTANDAIRVEFAVAAPTLAFVFGPITSRAVAATLFSLRMVRHAKDQTALARATLAGEKNALVARVEGVDGDDVALTTLGEAAGQTLVASREVLHVRHAPSKGTHYLLEGPSYGGNEAMGYRGESARRRVLATEDSHYLGWQAHALSPSAYWPEVAAGTSFLLLEHSILFGIAWVFAHSIR